MAIPESQLETWSHQGSIAQSSNTYRTIKNALESSDTPYAITSCSVFLQGSYGNDTNIYAESDVDVVIKLDDCWQSDLAALPQDQKDAYDAAYVNATYTHEHFKRDALSVLTDSFGSDVTAGDKAIAIAARGSRRKAHVIAAIQYRRYHKFRSPIDQSYDEGICFYNAAGHRIANYPRQHSDNLTRKHQDTNEWLKPMVRIFKNLREKLVEDRRLARAVAPSYYLEGVLYNVPSGLFGASYEDSFVNAVNWLRNDADLDQLVCANEQCYLLRDVPYVCWKRANCETFLDAVVRVWNDW
ncbi:MAG: nucleotidyltransferase domain-containing protein [Gammaproteobacteria bacterium]